MAWNGLIYIVLSEIDGHFISAHKTRAGAKIIVDEGPEWFIVIEREIKD